LDISGNQICGVSESGIGIYDASGLAALAKSIGNLKELNISSNYLKAEGAKILVPALKANGSLSDLDLSNNNLRMEGLSALAEVIGPTSIVKLNLANNDVANSGTNMSGVVKFANAIKDMGSLSKLTFSGDYSNSKPVAVEVGMTEADFSGASLGPTGAIILVAWLKHKVQHTTHYISGLITFSI
jgi:Ran GTPase-activating protein (RanGAP) involved in mRNA processing and transport